MDTRTNKIIEEIDAQTRLCRECKHFRIIHAETIGCFALLGKEENLTRCKCTEFVPSDNLDYIEWLAKKRGFLG